MKVWATKQKAEKRRSGIARAALAGASRQELLMESLEQLTRQESVDRVGAWIRSPQVAARDTGITTAFHGLVWDDSAHDTPSEWRTLSLEPPLPEDLLVRRVPVSQDLADVPASLLIGPQIGLRHSTWIPVAGREQVHGLILLGSKGRVAPEKDRAESVAAELALALELEEQENLARLCSADLTHTKSVLETFSIGHSVDTLLSRLVAECVADHPAGVGVGGIFAAIGVLLKPGPSAGQPPQVAFRWHSGDASWIRAMESAPLSQVWRTALEVRQVIGSEPPSALSPTSVARIVANPLAARGALLGILVVGLPAAGVSLATLERLQLRALLAASALERKALMEEEAEHVRSEQALLESLHEPLFLFDGAGKITASSRGARALLLSGSPRPDSQVPGPVPAGQLSDLFSSGDAERVHGWLRDSLRLPESATSSEADAPQAQLRNGINVRLQWVARTPGQSVAVLLQPLGVVAAPRQDDHAEAELQSVIEWLEEGVVLFDSHENVRAANSRFEQIMGLPGDNFEKPRALEGLIARLAGQAAEPAQFSARWRELAHGLEGGVREELHMVRPASRIVERAARPVLDSLGRRLGRVEIYRDLTAQRVFQSKLLQTEKLAALGQMVSGIAHELSNPLTSILGYAQRLLVHPDARGNSPKIRQIYQEAERAGAILRQLLLNARETMPERRLVSLNQIVMRAMELQRFSLAAEKIRAEMDLDPALPFVHGDPGQLQQVLINLLANARQALEQQGHGGIIQMRTRRNGGRRVILEVQDSGPGIPQAIQARIFDPFFTTKPAGVGTGLGLSIVLSVVREHGGQVRVQSPPQGGTTFQVEIPAATERQQEESRTAAVPARKKAPLQPRPLAGAIDRRAAGASGGMLQSHKGTRVLVVEDEPTVAQLIADVLQDEGMHVDVLLDGRQALERAGRESYDLVICDMKMPGLDGQHFYKSLERAENPLHERFLFVTGDIIGAQTREFLERHRLPHVAKPFRVEELTETVHDVLHARHLHEASAAEAAKKKAARNG